MTERDEPMGVGAVRWVLRAAVLVAAGVALSACHGGPHLDLVVTTTTDGSDASPGDGVCEMTPGSGDCSLRAAVDEANAQPADTHTSVDLPAGTYAITGAAGDDANASGDLDVALDAGALTLIGTGAVTLDGAGLDRVLEVHSGQLAVRNLTITGGVAPAGGGIRARPATSVRVHASVLRDNEATGAFACAALIGFPDPECSGSLGGGGGIFSTGHVEVIASTLHDNVATGGNGCATTEISFACSWAHGGAIAVATGTMPEEMTGPALTIVGSTVSGNRVDTGSGGGLWVADAHAEVRTTTFAGNEAPAPPPDLFIPSGTAVATSVVYPSWPIHPGTVSLQGTLLQGPADLCDSGTASLGFTVAADATCGLAQPTDLPSTAVALEPLAALGGRAPGHVPAAGSPAVDAIPTGTPSSCDGSIPVDQVGQPRPTGPGCDIGAIERQPG